MHFLPTYTFLALFIGQAQQANAAFLDVQSGSLMGLIHISAGVTVFKNHQLSGGLGYVPKLDNHRELSLLSFRYRYQHPYRLQINKTLKVSPLNFGFTLLVGSHKDLFVSLPSQYPDDDYYDPTAFRYLFNYQSILHLDTTSELYFDLSILEVGAISYVREPNFFVDNYRFLGLEGISYWGFGLRRRF